MVLSAGRRRFFVLDSVSLAYSYHDSPTNGSLWASCSPLALCTMPCCWQRHTSATKNMGQREEDQWSPGISARSLELWLRQSPATHWKAAAGYVVAQTWPCLQQTAVSKHPSKQAASIQDRDCSDQTWGWNQGLQSQAWALIKRSGVGRGQGHLHLAMD